MPPNHLSLAATPNGIHRCSILPTYLLRRLALDDDPHGGFALLRGGGAEEGFEHRA